MDNSPRIIRDEGRVVSAWVMSVVGHFVALGLTGLVLASSLGKQELSRPHASPPPPRDDVVEIDLPTVADGTLAIPLVEPSAAPLARGGGEGTPRVDNGSRGRGGTDTASDPALNLADRDEHTLMSPEIRSRVDRSQLNRIRSSKKRESREDWRASREPMELTFLASGRRGDRTDRPERRTPSDRDPSAGARDRGAPHVAGGALGSAPLPPGVGREAHDIGGPLEGAARAQVGLGVRDGVVGNDHRDAANVGLARPMVQEGTPSVPSNAQGKPKDNVDAEQEVATAMQALVHASNAGGTPGLGPGGQAGPGAPGAGGLAGQGSVSRALGNGQGPGLDVDPRDRRRSEYMRKALAKIYPLWANAFPKWAAAEGLQGTVIVTFTILADGSVASVSITRPSGIPEYDENSRKAVLRAAPFGPLPPEFGQSFRWSMPLKSDNPAVLPPHPKPRN